jgi:hypothetical protein
MTNVRPLQLFVSVGLAILVLVIVSTLYDTSREDVSVLAAQVTPTPKPPPKCQQDNKSRKIGERMLFSPDENHYTHIIADPTDARYWRVLTDGNLVAARFRAVGPIVFHPKSDRFAFIGAQDGTKYVLEYLNGAQTPQVAEPIQDAWKNWVCYGATGKYLFTIAMLQAKWHLLVREEKAQASFMRYAVTGDPSALELLAPRDDGREGFQYRIVTGEMEMEIKNWLK